MIIRGVSGMCAVLKWHLNGYAIWRSVHNPLYAFFLQSKMKWSSCNFSGSAHFEGRLIPVDDPDLKVTWWKDGVQLRSGHKFRIFHDFGIVILDVLWCYEEDR